MGGSPVFDSLTIQSHKGPYTAHFGNAIPPTIGAAPSGKTHVIVDEKVARAHAARLKAVLDCGSVLPIEANEDNKSIERIPDYVNHLVGKKIRRGDVLLGIGGGIIQDITCFLAATLLRGVDWDFYPTTLLAQADSCIGSKRSINVGKVKNIFGTFTPPRPNIIGHDVLKSLHEMDLRSGVGEMLKVHIIDGPASFDQIAQDYEKLFRDTSCMRGYIRSSLEIKKRMIEEDEFDLGVRNVLNYGHSFGH